VWGLRGRICLAVTAPVSGPARSVTANDVPDCCACRPHRGPSWLEGRPGHCRGGSLTTHAAAARGLLGRMLGPHPGGQWGGRAVLGSARGLKCVSGPEAGWRCSGVSDWSHGRLRPSRDLGTGPFGNSPRTRTLERALRGLTPGSWAVPAVMDVAAHTGGFEGGCTQQAAGGCDVVQRALAQILWNRRRALSGRSIRGCAHTCSW
jgi:hypothetical protein